MIYSLHLPEALPSLSLLHLPFLSSLFFCCFVMLPAFSSFILCCFVLFFFSYHFLPHHLSSATSFFIPVSNCFSSLQPPSPLPAVWRLYQHHSAPISSHLNGMCGLAVSDSSRQEVRGNLSPTSTPHHFGYLFS